MFILRFPALSLMYRTNPLYGSVVVARIKLKENGYLPHGPWKREMSEPGYPWSRSNGQDLVIADSTLQGQKTWCLWEKNAFGVQCIEPFWVYWKRDRGEVEKGQKGLQKKARHFSLLSFIWKRAIHSFYSAKSPLFSFLAESEPSTELISRPKRKSDYQTSYACEGSRLQIECPTGLYLDVIRANYGRFSITICNLNGTTHWSVSCTSPVTLRVIKSR